MTVFYVFKYIYKIKFTKINFPLTLTERDKQTIWHPFTPLTTTPDPLPVAAAQGCEILLTDGRKMLDGISSWWVNLHGHSHPHIAQAIAEQALRLEHVIFAGFTHEPAIRLAERLLAILPGNFSKVFYSDNGSTAVEVALKMAFQFWHNQGIAKRKIIALTDAYHGDTFGAMSVGGRSAFTAPFVPFLFEVDFLDFPACHRRDCCGGNVDETCPFPKSRKWLEDFRQMAADGNVAAFIFEPLVQGASGMRMYSPELLDELIYICKQFNILTIADEVMTGFGRTGKLFACEYLQYMPEIICLSKGITGGAMALGATVCTEPVIDAFREDDLLKTFFHGHSFTANPLACAAANASLDLLLTAECEENRRRIAGKHEAFADKIFSYVSVNEVRTLGTILALEINTTEETSYINEARHSLYDFFLKKNILLRPLGNVLYVLPPYVMTDAELERIYEAIEELLLRLPDEKI
jgi:adenosylmethionine---8-amino-7-oxononanoate aminotransferase